MIYWPLYLIAASFALYSKRMFNALILALGAGVGVVHHIMSSAFDGISALHWLTAIFLLSCIWFHALDSIGAKTPSILAGALCLFLALGVVDAASFPNVDTVYFTSYPIVITIFNLAMIYFGATDNGNFRFGGSSTDLLRKNSQAHKADL